MNRQTKVTGYPPTEPARTDDRSILETLAGRWKSGNDVETERIHITRAEFERLMEPSPVEAELRKEVERLRNALLVCARKAEALKRDCGADPESGQAGRNSQYQDISTTAHIALGTISGPTCSMPELPPSGSALRRLGARLADLLDEDQFAECEALLLAAQSAQ